MGKSPGTNLQAPENNQNSGTTSRSLNGGKRRQGNLERTAQIRRFTGETTSSSGAIWSGVMQHGDLAPLSVCGAFWWTGRGLSLGPANEPKFSRTPKGVPETVAALPDAAKIPLQLLLTNY